MTTRRAVAALIAILVAVLGAGVASAQADLDLRVRSATLDEDGTTRVVVAVSGAAVGEPLGRANFEVLEDGAPVEIVDVQPLLDGDEQVSVGFLVDVSGSMEGQPFTDMLAAAKSFIDVLVPRGVAVGIVSFGSTAQVAAPFALDVAELNATLDGLGALGTTALYDAVVLGASEMQARSGQHNLVVFSDGGDNASNADLQAAIRAADRADAPINVVSLLTPDTDAAALDALASATGGRVVEVADSAQLAAVFQDMASELTSQWVIAYQGTTEGPGEVDLAVTASFAGARSSDSIVALNPRVAPPPPPLAVTLPEPGLLGEPAALWVGLGTAFLAAVLLLAILLTGPTEGRAARVLRRGLRLYSRDAQGQRAQGGGLSATAFGRRAVDFVDNLPKPEGFEERYQLELDRAGWPLRASEFLVLSAAVAVGGFFVGLALVNWLVGLAFIFLGALAPRVALANKVQRRQTAFADQLPDTLQLLAGSLKAGYGLLQGIDTVVKETSPPMSTEFARVLTEARLGLSIDEALEGMAHRVGSEDFQWVVVAVNIQRQIGGNLAELLETVSNTLREREQVRRQIKVLSAEGKLSAVILGVLPFVITGYLLVVNPTYLATLWTETMGRVMLAGAVVLMGAGILWMRKIIDIDV